MNILDSRFKYTPALNTNIRDTFARLDPNDDWQSRLEGAMRVLKMLAEQSQPRITHD